jgi:DNA-binding NarL/FixJ family response regulator
MLPQPLRIIIAASNTAMRDALRMLLEVESVECVIETAADAETLLIQIGQTYPTLVLLDWRLPGMRPVPLLRVVRELRPSVKVVVLGERSEDNVGARNGADGFALKTEPPDKLVTLIRAFLSDGAE